MQRRGFLGLLGAVVVAPLVPTPVSRPPYRDWHASGQFVGLDLASQPDRSVFVVTVTREQAEAAIGRALMRQLRRSARF